jgi:hypothetical protein
MTGLGAAMLTCVCYHVERSAGGRAQACWQAMCPEERVCVGRGFVCYQFSGCLVSVQCATSGIGLMATTEVVARLYAVCEGRVDGFRV